LFPIEKFRKKSKFISDPGLSESGSEMIYTYGSGSCKKFLFRPNPDPQQHLQCCSFLRQQLPATNIVGLIQDFKSVKKFNVFNTNNLWISLDAIKRIMDESSLDMEIIVNPKALGRILSFCKIIFLFQL
jgi:hypothetical protein